MGVYENLAGLGVRNHYGPKIIDEGTKFGGQITTSGGEKENEWVFSYNDLPSAANLSMEALIPEGAKLISARFQVIEAFVGGTSYDIGLEENDGSAIDLDGLWDLLPLAEINAVNEWSDALIHAGTNSGVLLDTTVGLSADAYLIVVASGTFTAGRARIVIRFTEADFDPTGNYVSGGVKGAGA